MSVGRQVGREASVYLSGFALVSFLQLLAMPILTRYLGPVAYGNYSMAVAIATGIAGITAVGGELALSRYWFVADSDRGRRDLAFSLISTLTVWSVVVVTGVVLVAEPLVDALGGDPELARYVQLGVIALVPAQLARMLGQILRNEFRPVAYATTAAIAGALSVSIGLVLCLGRGWGVMGVLLGTLIGETAGCVLRAPMVVQRIRGSFSLALLFPPLRFGLPFVPAALASWVFVGADRVVVGRYLTAAELGAYSVAAMVISPFSILLSALGQAWIPRVSELYESAPQAALRTGARALGLSSLAFGALSVGAGAVAPVAIRIVAGEEYLAGAQALPLLSVGAAFLGMSLFMGTGYTLAQRTSMVSLITLAAAGINLAMLLALVPRIGLLGAAASVATGYACVALGSLWYSHRCLPLRANWALVAAAIMITISAAVAYTFISAMWLRVAVTVAALGGLGALGWRDTRIAGRP